MAVRKLHNFGFLLKAMGANAVNVQPSRNSKLLVFQDVDI